MRTQRVRQMEHLLRFRLLYFYLRIYGTVHLPLLQHLTGTCPFIPYFFSPFFAALYVIRLEHAHRHIHDTTHAYSMYEFIYIGICTKANVRFMLDYTIHSTHGTHRPTDIVSSCDHSHLSSLLIIFYVQRCLFMLIFLLCVCQSRMLLVFR